jgi:hypothetical protein
MTCRAERKLARSSCPTSLSFNRKGHENYFSSITIQS